MSKLHNVTSHKILISSYTVHNNSQSVYVGFFYLLVNASVKHTDHHQIEKYRYRRKSATV